MTGFYWLVSYPKSGNTWLRLALRSLRNGGVPLDFTEEGDWFPNSAARRPFDETLDVESSDLTPTEAEALRPRCYEAIARSGAEPMIRKTHDAWILTAAGEPLFPPAVTLGAIYIVRDPRDVAVSFAHHNGIGIDRAIATMSDPTAALSRHPAGLPLQFEQRVLTWSSHVESWIDAPGIRLLVLRYEDMLAQPEALLARAAAFLQWIVTPSAVAAAVEATRFDTLRAMEERYGFRENRGASLRFFRQGIAGGWRDTLTEEQTARVERDHRRVMARLGYDLK